MEFNGIGPFGQEGGCREVNIGKIGGASDANQVNNEIGDIGAGDSSSEVDSGAIGSFEEDEGRHEGAA